MNGPTPGAPNKQLNQVLQTYQMFAMNALGGPAQWSMEMAKYAAGARFPLADGLGLSTHMALNKRFAEGLQGKEMRSLPFDFKTPHTQSNAVAETMSVPLLMQADAQYEQSVATLEGEKIACFNIGGEKRLCLPQILNTVLKDFSLTVINQVCDDSHIYCSRCNPEQLQMFKRSRILPLTAPSCGLITMTDAERLCGALLHKSVGTDSREDRIRRPINEACIPVCHECFGEGQGYLKSDLYKSDDSKCIECVDCGGVYSPRGFVGHSHYNQESGNHICHWGFERNKWRNYLMVDSDDLTDPAEIGRLEIAFHDIINRFAEVTLSTSPRKRSDTSSTETTESGSDAKVRRLSEVSAASPPHAHLPSFASPSWRGAAAAGWSQSPEPSSSTQRMSPTDLKFDMKSEPRSPHPDSRDSHEQKYKESRMSVRSPDVDSPIRKDSRSSNGSKDTGMSTGGKVEIWVQLEDVMDSLERMENLFLSVLVSSTCPQKDEWKQKYMAHSEAVRRRVISSHNNK